MSMYHILLVMRRQRRFLSAVLSALTAAAVSLYFLSIPAPPKLPSLQTSRRTCCACLTFSWWRADGCLLTPAVTVFL